jgi:hypothetical protein
MVAIYAFDELHDDRALRRTAIDVTPRGDPQSPRTSKMKPRVAKQSRKKY